MGVSSSKNPQHHVRPLNINPYGRPMGSLGPPNFAPGYVVPINGQYPQGFIPPYSNIPPQQLVWPPQDKPRKRRKTRKTRTHRDAGDTRRRNVRDQHMPMPEPNSGQTHAPVVPTPTPRSAPAPAPVPTPSPAPERSSIRRAQTPFHRAQVVEEDEDSSSPPPVLPHANTLPNERARTPAYAAPQSHSSRRASSRRKPEPLYQPQRPEAALRDLDMVRALEPLETPRSGVFGPPQSRPQTPLRNPLPPPPRDLYDSSPYKTLLTLPQTTALLTQNFARRPSEKEAKKKPRKGLFRAFTSRKHENEEPKAPNVHIVPIYVNPTSGNNPVPPMPAIPPLPRAGVPGPSVPSGHMPRHSTTRREPIRYNEDSEYWSFMNHSPHRIIYDNKEWPTGTHLLEARKYLPGHPAIAEEIRFCGDVGHVYPISANYQQFEDPHWSQRHMEVLEDVLYLKFSQHPDLRMKLWETEDIPLIYDDRNDPYWGVGPKGDGANVHGQLMEKVRARLLEGRVTQ